MNYITACPACETQFLITKEHLKAHRGKVQCGNCSHIFNAKNRLIEISEDVTNEEAPNKDSPNVEEDGATENSFTGSGTAESNFLDSHVLESSVQESNETEHTSSEIHTNSEAELDEIVTNDSDSEFPTSESTSGEATSGESLVNESAFNEPLATEFTLGSDEKPIKEKLNVVLQAVPDLSDLTSSDLAQPDLDCAVTTRDSYISQPIAKTVTDNDIESIRAPILIEDLTTDPKFQLTKPKRNVWLLMAICLLLVVAVLQSIYFLRANIAANYPQFKPYLMQACEHLRCKINLPQQLDLLTIDDSDMQESQDYQDVIDFSSLIINNANHVQAYPNIELTLTDAEDKPVLRKLVKPQEYLQATSNAAAGIAAREEERIKLMINVHNLSVAGYRVLLTY